MNKKLFKLAKLVMKFAQIEINGVQWTYEGDLEVGTEVFIEKEEDFVPVEDGEYTKEDKVIVVADGKVAEIREIETEFAKAKKQFEATYQEVQQNIWNALVAAGLDAYILENTDTYAVVCEYQETGEKLYKYDITINEDGTVTLGEKIEVKHAYVPVDEVEVELASEDGDRIAELEGLLKDRDAVISELTQKIKDLEAELEKKPVADPVEMNKQYPTRSESGAKKYFAE